MRYDLLDRRAPDPGKARLRREVGRQRRVIRLLTETLQFARDVNISPRIKDELEAAIEVGLGLQTE